MSGLRRALAWLREMLTLPEAVDSSIASRIASLTASLDDANRTIARLSSEKAQLERVIATVKETVGGF